MGHVLIYSNLGSFFLSPVKDAGIPAIAMIWGATAILLFPTVILVEAVILKLMRWGTFRISLHTSVIMNILSTLVGIIYFCKIAGGMPGIIEILISGIVSVAIEAGVLWLIDKNPIGRVMVTALSANLVSYTGIVILYTIITNTLAPPVAPLVRNFPDTDIVYLVNSTRRQLGFVNQVGFDKQIQDLNGLVSKPVWMDDGKSLYLLNNTKHAVDFGEITVWKQGQRSQTCQNSDWWAIENIGGIIQDPSGIQLVVNNHGQQILRIDMQRCKKLDTLVDVGNTGMLLIGASLSTDGKYLLYTTENRRPSITDYSILRMDLNTGTTTKIGSGAYPSWSPDGNTIAYLRLDGIYVMLTDGSQSKRLIEYKMNGVIEDEFGAVLPEPRWSPDGNWLIYHRFVFQSRDSNDADIFKLNVATGEEIKVTDDGLYPYWRK